MLIRLLLSSLLALSCPCVVFGQNLIPNSSFELTGGGKGFLNDRRWVGQAPEGQSVTDAPHGRSVACGGWYKLTSACFHVPDPGSRYVLSFYMRGDNPGGVQVRLGANPSDPNNPQFVLRQDVQPTKDWKRYSFPCTMAGGLNDLYYIEFYPLINSPSATLYIDAVQLERGSEPSPYAPCKPVEFGLKTDRPRNVFEPGEPLEIVVQACNNGPADTAAKLQMLVKDFRDRVVAKQAFEMDLAPSGLTQRKLSIPCDKRGSLRLELYRENGPVEDELVVAIMPPVPVEDRGVGVQQAFETDPVWAKYLGLKYGGGDICDWSWVQPEPGDTWKWERSDKTVDECLKNGLQFRATYLLNYGGMDWSRKKPDIRRPWPNAQNPSMDLDDWEKYVYEVVNRYKGRIDSWTVWNEPWGEDPALFIELLKVTRDAIKRANPQAEVCGADIPPAAGSWAEKFIKLGGLQYLDALSSHAYAQIGGYLPESSAVLKKWACADGIQRPVYNTECTNYPWFSYTWYTHIQPGNTGSWSNPGGQVTVGYPMEEAAARWAKMVVVQHAVGVSCVMPHYSLSAGVFPSTQTRGGAEMDGSWTPYASAWAVAGRMVTTAEGLGQVEGSADLRAFLFNKRGTPIGVLWTRENEGGQYPAMLGSDLLRKPDEAAKNLGVVRKSAVPQVHDCAIPLAKGAFNAYDIMGNELPVKEKNGLSLIPVSSDPVYIVAGKSTVDALRGALAKAEVYGLGAFDLSASFACGRRVKAGVLARIASKQGRDQHVRVILNQAPEGMAFPVREKKVLLPAHRTVEVLFEPSSISSSSQGAGGFALTVKSPSETKKAVTERLWVLESRRWKTAPNLDGKLDDWAGRPRIDLDQAKQVSDGQPAWQGPGDLSARVMSGWDEKNLYFAYHISDAGTLHPCESSISMYGFDCVEVFLDADIMSDMAVRELSSDDYQISVGPGLTGDRGEVIHYCGSTLTGLRGAWLKTDTGYNLEFAVPWSNFISQGAVGQAGIVLGFLPTVCDNDGAGATWKKISWTGYFDAFHNTSLWGKLVLTE